MIKEKIQNLDILMCHNSSWISKTIRLVTKSRVSHNALAIRIEKELFIIDAQRRGVNVTSFNQWHKKYKYNFYIYRPINFSPPLEKERIYQKAIESIGIKKYDFISLLIWQPIYLLTGVWNRTNQKRQKNRFYCSEFIAYCFEIPDGYKMSPEMLKEYLKINTDFISIYPMGVGFF